MDITLINKHNMQYFSYLIGGNFEPGQEALGVVDDGKPVAAGLFSAADSICVIDWIAVDESRRREGIGRFLFDSVRQYFEEKGYTHLLAFYEGSAESTIFLRRLGFSCVPSIPAYAVSCASLRGSAKCRGLIKKYPGNNIIPYDSLERSLKAKLRTNVEKAGFSSEDLLNGNYDNDWSFAIVSENKHTGTLLAMQRDEDIYVTLLLTTGGDASGPLRLFSALLSKLESDDHSEGNVIFLGANDSIIKFLIKFLEGEAELQENTGSWEAVMQIGGDYATQI